MENQELLPKTKNKFKKVLFFTTFAFVFAVCLGLAEIFSGLLIPANTTISQGLSTPTFKLHFLSITKSQVRSSAVSLAEDYQKIGAGGYPWEKEGYFHVVASCYEKENDAVLVQNNIKQTYNLDSEIFTVEFPSLAFSGEYESEGKKVLAKALKGFYTAYQNLFDIAISLDTSVYNDISARLAVNNVYSSFNSTFTDFKTIFSESEDSSITRLNACMAKCVGSLENLCSGKLVSKNQTPSSLIKYRYTEFLSIYLEFLSSF